MENWKPIKGYESLYEISDQGRIRRTDGRVLKPHLRSNYTFIALHDSGKTKSFDVHRLVAQEFCEGRTFERCEVNHKNLNKLDNRAVNLEWVTHKENVQHAIQNGACEHNIGVRNRRATRCKELGIDFDSSYSAAEYLNKEYFGFSKSIPTMARNIRWRAIGHCGRFAYGFHWYDVCLEPSTTIPKGSTDKRLEMGSPA